MAMTHDKPAADIIDLNATRAETEAADGPETDATQTAEVSIEGADEKAAETPPADAAPETAAIAAANLPVGQILANARKGAELSLADIVAATKIKQAHLEAIEASDNDSLPATPFTAGFIKVYANHLELDSNALVKQFKDEVAAGTVAATPDAPAAPAPELTAPMAAPSYQGGDTTRWASIVGIAAIALFALWIMMQVFKPTSGTDAPVTPRVVEAEPEPTVTLAEAQTQTVLTEAPASEEMTTEDVFAPENAEPAAAVPVTEETTVANEPAVETETETTVAEAVEETAAPEETAVEEAVAEAPAVETETVAPDAAEPEAGDASEPTDVELAMASQAEALAASVEETAPVEEAPVETEPELSDAFNIASVEGAPAILVDAPVEEPALPETDFIAMEPAAEEPVEVAETEAADANDAGDAQPVNTADLNAAQTDLITTPPAQEISAPPPVRQPAPEPKIVNAKVRKQAPLAYPARCELRAADTETVVVRMDVLTDGRPANVGVQSSTNSCFDKAATAAARRLRFTPRTVNGTQQVEVGKTVTFNFPK